VRLSYTALRTFQQCHFRYHLRYDRGLAGRPRPTAQSSRALHGALHLFHQGLKSQQAAKDALFPQAAVSLDTLLAHFKGYYDNPTRRSPLFNRLRFGMTQGLSVFLVLLGLSLLVLGGIVWVAAAVRNPQVFEQARGWAQILGPILTFFSLLIAALVAYGTFLTPFEPVLIARPFAWRLGPATADSRSFEVVMWITISNKGALSGTLDDLAVQIALPKGKWVLEPLAFVKSDDYYQLLFGRKFDYPPFEGPFTPIFLLELARALQPEQRPLLEKMLFLGACERVAVRLIAARMPEAVVNERRRRARNSARKRGYTPSQAHLTLLAWNLFITNVPGAVWTPATVCTAYSLRWQVELVFKSWKSDLHLATLTTKTAESTLCYLYGRMLLILLT